MEGVVRVRRLLFFSPQAAREIMKPSCLRTEVTMLVFMSNSTSISSGVIIYFFVEKTKLFYKRIYARTTLWMKITKEQVFDI